MLIEYEEDKCEKERMNEPSKKQKENVIYTQSESGCSCSMLHCNLLGGVEHWCR